MLHVHGYYYFFNLAKNLETSFLLHIPYVIFSVSYIVFYHFNLTDRELDTGGENLHKFLLSGQKKSGTGALNVLTL